MWLRMMLVGLALLGIESAAHAQGAKASSPPEFARKIDDLKPGEWVWAPEVAPEAALSLAEEAFLLVFERVFTIVSLMAVFSAETR